MELSIKGQGLQVRVNTRGAELIGLSDLHTGEEYIWQGNPDIWDGHSPLLFPVVGRLKGNAYRLNGEIYSMPKHGFARTGEFQVKRQWEGGVSLLLEDSAKTRAIYPFRFELEVVFELTRNHLEITHMVRNPSTEPMYFSIGAHPGFSCEMGDTLIFERRETCGTYWIDADKSLRSHEKKALLEDCDRLVITEELFENDALILDNLKSKRVSLESRRRGDVLTVDFFDAPYLGLWAKPGAPYVCIEPWYGVDDTDLADGDFTRKEGIITLGGKESFAFPVHISIAGEPSGE